MVDKKATRDASLSLRLWSDSVSFSNIAERITLEPATILQKGEPTILPKSSGPIHRAKRNYVSFRDCPLDGGGSLSFHVDKLLNCIAASDLAPMIQSNNVEAVIWLAIFDDKIPWAKYLTRELIDLATALNVKLLIENYRRSNEAGAPLIEYV